jgi:hypothetical protein
MLCVVGVAVDCKETVDVGEPDTACEEDEDSPGKELETAAGADVALTTSDVGSAGYICASRIIMSGGRSWYHLGELLPVGIGASVPVGMAVLSTDSTERRIGSMVCGSIMRAMSSLASRPPTRIPVDMAGATSAKAERINVDFMLARGVVVIGVDDGVDWQCCGSVEKCKP